jgi:hypothetical protein
LGEQGHRSPMCVGLVDGVCRCQRFGLCRIGFDVRGFCLAAITDRVEHHRGEDDHDHHHYDRDALAGFLLLRDMELAHGVLFENVGKRWKHRRFCQVYSAAFAVKNQAQ